jgi:ferrous iron transport protein B
MTIPENLAAALGSWGDPLGLDTGNLADTEAVAAEQAVSVGTFGAMALRFDGTAGAFAYLLLILLYFPCTATLAAVYRETNVRWMLFVAGWTTGLAYATATLYYQAATFARDPVTASAWIGGLSFAFAVTVLVLRMAGRGRASPAAAAQGV